MPVDQDVQRKLQDVLDEAKAVTATLRRGAGGAGSGPFADEGMAQRWATKMEALLTSVFGTESHFVRDARRFSQQSTTWHESQVKALWGVIAGAVDASRDGYVFNLHEEAAAEVEGALLGSASKLASEKGINEPERRATSVLTGSVLERHLRALYAKHGGAKDPESLTIEPLGIELKGLKVIDEVQRKRISAMGASRNSAAHDAVFNDTAEDVKRMIEGVTDLCARLR